MSTDSANSRHERYFRRNRRLRSEQCSRASADRSRDGRARAIQKEGWMTQSPLVLIVDDAADNREIYAEYLRFRGYRTIEAATGSDAISTMREHCPEVVLLDLKLPDIDGMEVSRRLRATREGSGAKIIALSACVFPDDVAGALESGCHAFLQKPCLPDVVVSEIERLLQ
jgi:two-component system cell cycle response regulator DivK